MSTASVAPLVIGRHAIYGAIGSGGMATVHLGRLTGPSGFTRTVAIKRLHPHLAAEREFVEMLLDEARVAAQISHPNVVSILDVVKHDGEILLVMEYVHGCSLSGLSAAARARGERVPPDIACAVLVDVLEGLHAAHDAKGELAQPLDIVHRDVSPQNVLVGIDGVARVADFGVAKAHGRLQMTRDGEIKGKLAYMAPEQLLGAEVTRRTDLYAASVVLWELLTARRLFASKQRDDLAKEILVDTIEAPSAIAADVPEPLNAVVLRGLTRDASQRFATAREMAIEVRRAATVAPPSRVAEWVQRLAAPALAARVAHLEEIAGHSASTETLVASVAATKPTRRWLLALAALGACAILVAIIAHSLAP